MNENNHDPICRRRFLARLSVGIGALGAAALAVPALGFIFGPFFRKPPAVWRAVGKIEQFKIGTTVAVRFVDSSPLPWAGVTALTAAWLRRVDQETFIAFAINCSHLGCPVRWQENSELFMCPCHGGVYYSDGSVAAGPPPRPLTRYQVRLQDGDVQIQTGPIPVA